MPQYTFLITEGPQVQEILLGVRHGVSAFYTQKTTFLSGVSLVRPGALLTVRVGNESYPIYSSTFGAERPRGLGLRYDMFTRALDFAVCSTARHRARAPTTSSSLTQARWGCITGTPATVTSSGAGGHEPRSCREAPAHAPAGHARTEHMVV